jgi:RNA polymerase sigma factor (sigma-70 family)
MRPESLSPPVTPPDADLIMATRQGGTSAFAELYHRHVGAARRLARSLCRDAADVEDLVAETFARVLASLRAGNGPDLAFRPYLLTTLRHACYDRAKRDKRVELTGDIHTYEQVEAFVDPTITGLERSFAARAFAKLPERWRAVLWHTEVEGNSHAQVASRLGLTTNGVAALAFRARERLRQMYLQEHLADATEAVCRETANRLGAYVRRGLASRDQVKVDAHLRSCAACQHLSAELTEVNSALHTARGLG